MNTAPYKNEVQSQGFRSDTTALAAMFLYNYILFLQNLGPLLNKTFEIKETSSEAQIKEMLDYLKTVNEIAIHFDLSEALKEAEEIALSSSDATPADFKNKFGFFPFRNLNVKTTNKDYIVQKMAERIALDIAQTQFGPDLAVLMFQAAGETDLGTMTDEQRIDLTDTTVLDFLKRNSRENEAFEILKSEIEKAILS